MRIKRVTLSLLLIILVNSNLFSQQDLFQCTPNTKGKELEVLVMPSRTWLWGNEGIRKNLHAATNYSTGVTFAFVKNNSIIRAGLLYEKKGWSNQMELTFVDSQTGNVVWSDIAKVRSNFYYITVPIQYGWRFGKAVRFEPALGFYASWLLNNTLVSKQDGSRNYRDVSDHTNKFDYGLAASVRAFFPIKPRIAAIVGIHDYLGLANINAADVADKSYYSHNVLGVSVGIGVKL